MNFTFDIDEAAQKAKGGAANPANPANPEPKRAEISNFSNFSNEPPAVWDDLDPAAEARRVRVLDMIKAHPGARWACLSDLDADPDNVIVAVAMRGVATFELHIPRAKWDGILFLEALDRHTVQ